MNGFWWPPRRPRCDWIVLNRAERVDHFRSCRVERLAGQPDPSAGTFRLPIRSCWNSNGPGGGSCSASERESSGRSPMSTWGSTGTWTAQRTSLASNRAWKSKLPIQRSNSYESGKLEEMFNRCRFESAANKNMKNQSTYSEVVKVA